MAVRRDRNSASTMTVKYGAAGASILLEHQYKLHKEPLILPPQNVPSCVTTQKTNGVD